MLNPLLPFVLVGALLVGAIIHALVGLGVARWARSRATVGGQPANPSSSEDPPRPRPAPLPLAARAGVLLTFAMAAFNTVLASGLLGPSRLIGIIGTVLLVVAGTFTLSRSRHARWALGTAVVVTSVLLAGRVFDYHRIARDARAGVARSDANRQRCCESDYRHCTTLIHNPCMRYGFDAFGYQGRADDARWLGIAAQGTIDAGLVAFALVALGTRKARMGKFGG